MSVFKCKMCGGNLGPEDGSGIAVCEYCGTQQTLSKSEDEIVKNLYNRANSLRLQCEFDRAEEIYEKILEIDQTEAEAHWGLVLCAYGIEYVEEPGTFRRIPTCHRMSYEAVMASADYLAAVEYGDAVQCEIYKKEAEAIDKIQRSILDIVKTEEPFDVFICYKETGKDGRRTEDSVIAGAIYDQLTKEGLKVFFAAVTLENRLGEEYEPYIFAALHSARVMLAIGTRPEHLQAVWVKNEWSRYLKLLKTDPSRLLIPCYRDMDAYELPEELSHLQAQDLSKIGAVQDLIRGIRKVVWADDAKAGQRANGRKETVVIQESGGTAKSLLKRAFLFLEDKDWDNADRYCEKVLDQEPENAMAYVGKLMAELRVSRQEGLVEVEIPFEDHNNYRKAIRFADDELRAALQSYNVGIRERNETERKTLLYEEACVRLKEASTEKECIEVSKAFQALEDFDFAEEMAQECLDKAEKIQSERYHKAVDMMNQADTMMNQSEKEDTYKKYTAAEELFATLQGFRDADQLNEKCKEQTAILRKERIYESAKEAMHQAKDEYDFARVISKLQQISGWKDVDERLETCRRLEGQLRKKAKRKQKIISMLIIAAIMGGVACFVYYMVIVPEQRYNAAVSLMEEGDYEEAYEILKEMNEFLSYKDSDVKQQKIEEIFEQRESEKAQKIQRLQEQKEAEEAKRIQEQKESEEAIRLQEQKESGEAKRDIGSIVKFGSYEQDNNKDNGTEEIEWIVLTKYEGLLLLISKYCLDSMMYNSSDIHNSNWADSEIKKWLNSNFLIEAFNVEERKWIVPSEYKMSGGWELQVREIESMTAMDILMQAETGESELVSLLPCLSVNDTSLTSLIKEFELTPYAAEKKCKNMYWWSRLVVDGSEMVCAIGENGIYQEKAVDDSCLIRPIIWVSEDFWDEG